MNTIEVRIREEPVSNIKQGVTLIDRIDEELDTGTVIVLYTNEPTEYRPFTPLSVIIGNGTETIETRYYYIDSDQITMISAEGYYQHTIGVISVEKKLEKHILPSIAFTNSTVGSQQTIQQQLERLNNIYPLEQVANHSQTRLLVVPTKAEWDVNAPQIFLNRPTVKEAYDSILSYLNQVPKMYDYDLLDYKQLNQKNTLRTLSGYHNISREWANTYYAKQIEANVPNAVIGGENGANLVYFPSKEAYISLRGNNDGADVTTDNAVFKLPYPIYKLKQVKAKLQVMISGTLASTPAYVDFDITSFIFEQGVWNTLELPSSTWTPTAYARNKSNTLSYSYQSNEIGSVGTMSKYMLIFNQPNMTKLIQTAALENSLNVYSTTYDDTLTKLQNGNFSPTLFTMLINVVYEPMIDTLVRSEREDNEVIDSASNMNFGGRITDLARLGSNMNGLINRLGNGDITLTKRFDSFNDRWRIGDYTSDGYIVTVVETAIYNDCCICNIHFTKNFNRISNFIGVNTEYRQYEIPRTGVVRHLYYNEYLMLGVNIPYSNNTMVDPYGWLKQTLGAADVYENVNNTIKIASTVARETSSSTSGTEIYSNVASYSSGKSVAFTFGYDDTIVGGYQLQNDTTLSTRYVQPPIKYTLVDGTLPYMGVNLYIKTQVIISGVTPNTDLTQAQMSAVISAHNTENARANRYPTNIAPSVSTIKSRSNFVVFKDVSEILKMTYQLHFIAESDDYIIYEALAKNCGLICDLTSSTRSLRFYTRTTPYLQNDHIGDNDEELYNTDNVQITSTLWGVKIQPLDVGQYWCIADWNTKEIYLAVNNGASKVYLYLKNKRV